MNMEPILWKKWEASRYENEHQIIIGEWNEDGNPYIISVPAQLRDMIIQLQHDAVDAKIAKEPKKEKCDCCQGKGYHVVEKFDKEPQTLYNQNVIWTINEAKSC